MKKIILFVLLPAMLGGCKKGNDAPAAKTILLSRSLYNGHTNSRYYYSTENRLIKVESYDEKPPNALTYYSTIEYDATGHITQITNYQAPGDIATGRTVVQYNANNQLASALNYDLQGATPNAPSTSQNWTYNANGDWIKLEVKDKNDKLLRRVNLSYNADGSLKQTEEYEAANNLLFLVGKTIYSVPGGAYPPGLDQLKILLGPDQTAMLFNEGIQFYSYDQNSVIKFNIGYQMSGREYNANGTLSKQTITVKRIKPPFPDEVKYAQYEYIEQ
jgi:hypothetical protein